MCNYRAGNLAEKLINGEASVGSCSDFEEYESKAKNHCTLSADFECYCTPSNRFEYEVNKQALDTLAGSIDINKEVCNAQ